MNTRLISHIVALIVVAMTVGCGSETEAPIFESSAAQTPPAQAAVAANDEPSDRAPAGPSVDDPRFELRLQADELTAGSQGTVSVRLVPRGEYKVEERYPYRVVAHDAYGLQFAQSELGRNDAAELSEERAVFDLEVTPAHAGTYPCSVDVEFAVCSASGCVPLTRTLTMDLSAS